MSLTPKDDTNLFTLPVLLELEVAKESAKAIKNKVSKLVNKVKK